MDIVNKKMKAWVVHDEYDEYSTVVFAETRNRARLAAKCTDCCEDMDYIHINPRRFPEADEKYCGKIEMEWNDTADRIFLAQHGWSCVEPNYSECVLCPASNYCDKYREKTPY